jgi:hypothetical protein
MTRSLVVGLALSFASPAHGDASRTPCGATSAIRVADASAIRVADARQEREEDAHTLLEKARAAERELRYEDALALLDSTWHSGGLSSDELVELFALGGRVAGSIGHEDEARLWFSRWLTLVPGAQLPSGTSPKLTALQTQARDALGGRALVARAMQRVGSIAIDVTSDPLGHVASIRAIDDRGDARGGDGRNGDDHAGDGDDSGGDEPGGKRSGDARGSDRGVAAVDGHAAVRSTSASAVQLLDRYGNVLATIVVTKPVPPHVTPVLARWTTWAIVAGGSAVVGGVALGVAVSARSSIRDLNADSANHQFTDAQPLEARFDRAQWVARFAFVATAGAGVASVILWRRGERLVVSPTGDGAVVTWSGQF